jgi:heme oxygenase (mycobilin-producing)
MAVTRIYRFDAAEGEAARLADTLRALAANTRGLEGCQGVELYADSDDAKRVVMIERWDSVDAHKAGAATRVDHVVTDIVALLAGNPDGAYYDTLGE